MREDPAKFREVIAKLTPEQHAALAAEFEGASVSASRPAPSAVPRPAGAPASTGARATPDIDEEDQLSDVSEEVDDDLEEHEGPHG